MAEKTMFYGTGRRKESVARVRLVPGTGKIVINGRDIDDYFGLETLKVIVRQPLNATSTLGKFDVLCTVTGGGVSGQAGAIRHGVARALLKVEDTWKEEVPGMREFFSTFEGRLPKEVEVELDSLEDRLNK